VKILVVDDDLDILQLCATALRGMGHDVTTCAAGNEALAAALTGEHDLALLDLNLPDVHGLEICRAIKMQAPGLPVIVISALDPREWRARSAEAGADHFLQKPIRLDALRHEVSMAEAARATLFVVVHDADSAHRARLSQAMRQAGFVVRLAETLGEIVDGPRPDLVILDASVKGVEGVVRWAGVNDVPCFVLFARGQELDDKLMRIGASLMVEKPVDPDAIILQARFLT
jgi:DNA-binding response OmpR family regulator